MLLLLIGQHEEIDALAETLVELQFEVRRQPDPMDLGDAPNALGASADGGLKTNETPDGVIAFLPFRGSIEERIHGWRREFGKAPLLVATDRRHLARALSALEFGADDYITLPSHVPELRNRLAPLADRSQMRGQLNFYQRELAKKNTLHPDDAHSRSMRQVLQRIERVAPMRSTVLILGESGVGKELVARSVHFGSRRAEGPFVPLNCAAMPASLIESELFGHEKGAFTGAHERVRGKFEIAHRGTLFLDEIGEMEASTQAKLLRVLEEREFMRVGGIRNLKVDVRVIAATNAPLEEHVNQGTFRQDLYYRLKVVTLRVPPLRNRRSDIPRLVKRFVEQICRANAIERKTLSPEVMEALIGHRWPGNVRELKNVLESLIVSVAGKAIDVEHLPPSITGARQPNWNTLEAGSTIAEMERELIRRTLEETGGNRTHSATLLGIGVRTLQRKIHTYNITIEPKKRRSRRRA